MQLTPQIGFPPELPISAHVEQITALLSEHQVVVVAGETGSGKTTQLPKILLAAGYGARALIGHTQPRRIAARSVASRIAEELSTPLGTTVGYAVRFAEQLGGETRIKVMTDGLLLTEIRRDKRLMRYDALIIDEAHERSLNVDFLLGYLKTVLKSRPELSRRRGRWRRLRQPAARGARGHRNRTTERRPRRAGFSAR